MTRRSLAVAIAIFWKFSACACSFVLKMVASLLTPSTIWVTSRPKTVSSFCFVAPVSSITSCRRAAAMDRWSMRISARMLATASGCVM